MKESTSSDYAQLAFYTLAHGDPRFIHQHVVDAFAAQNATDSDKPIKVAFALIGLYLMLEKGYTGREVQLEHIRLAKTRKDWPHFPLPQNRGSLTAAEASGLWFESHGEAVRKIKATPRIGVDYAGKWKD